MIAVDTNVVVRLIIGDEPEQIEKASCLVEQEGVWIAFDKDFSRRASRAGQSIQLIR